MNEKVVGLDIGYANTKIVVGGKPKIFPSVVGSPEQAKFADITNDTTITVRVQGKWRNVGEGAVVQSENTIRRNERGWYSTPEYLSIFHAALLHVANGSRSLNIDWLISGLPIAYYENDHEKLAEIMSGHHKVESLHGGLIDVTIQNVKIIPQGTGALIATSLNEYGEIVDSEIATSLVGMIDIGGKTTNIISARNFIDVSKNTQSVVKGGWDAIGDLRGPIQELIPELNIRDHELAAAIVAKKVKWGGRTYDLTDVIRANLVDFAENIINRAEQTFGKSGGQLDTILISGGGAALVGDLIVEMFDHEDVRVVDDPVFANAHGYYRLGVKFT